MRAITFAILVLSVQVFRCDAQDATQAPAPAPSSALSVDFLVKTCLQCSSLKNIYASSECFVDACSKEGIVFDKDSLEFVKKTIIYTVTKMKTMSDYVIFIVKILENIRENVNKLVDYLTQLVKKLVSDFISGELTKIMTNVKTLTV